MIGRKMDSAAKELGRKIISELEKISHSLTRATGKQNETGISPQQAPSQENSPRQRKPKASAQVEPTPNNPEQTKQSWYKTTQGWRTALEIIGIPFAIGYAIVTYLQWKDLRHNFEVSERAWIKMEVIFPQAPTTDMRVGVVIANIGKSAALQSLVQTMVEIVKSEDPPIFTRIPGDYTTSFALMFPGDKTNFGVEPALIERDGKTMRSLTDSEVEGIRTGKLYVAVLGQASYIDQFGSHWTRFCRWQTYATGATANANSCVQWNKVGDGRPAD